MISLIISRPTQHALHDHQCWLCCPPGTVSPFAALHSSGSYWGFICRLFGVTGPANFDPNLPRVQRAACSARGSMPLTARNLSSLLKRQRAAITLEVDMSPTDSATKISFSTGTISSGCWLVPWAKSLAEKARSASPSYSLSCASVGVYLSATGAGVTRAASKAPPLWNQVKVYGPSAVRFGRSSASDWSE